MTKTLAIEQECLYSVFRIYNLLLKSLEKIFVPYNISASKFNILMVIKHQASSDGISQVDICSKLIVGEANIAKITNKLYEQGYITRNVNQKDRRYNLLKITQKGSDLLDEIFETQEGEEIKKSLKDFTYYPPSDELLFYRAHELVVHGVVE